MANYKRPTVERPCLEELEEYAAEGIAETTDGCMAELDGSCDHGHVSWFLYLGLI